MRPLVIAGLTALLLFAGCGDDESSEAPAETEEPPIRPVTAYEIDEWMASDPDVSRVTAVVTTPARPVELRVHAAVALVHSYAVRDDMVDGVRALDLALEALTEPDRSALAEAITAELRGEVAESGELGGLSAALALGHLMEHVGETERARIADDGLAWALADFGRRAGARSEIALAFANDPPRSERLLEAMVWERNQAQLVGIAEHVAERGTDELRHRAGVRAAEISRAYEGEEFGEWVRRRVEERLSEGGADVAGEATQRRVEAAIALNRLNFVRDGAIPALRALREVPEARARLEELAADEHAPEEQREAARSALPSSPPSSPP